MFEPILVEEAILKPKPPKEEIEYRQRYIKGHINAIRTHITKAVIMVEKPIDIKTANIVIKMEQGISLLEKQLSKVERDAHDLFEIVKKAIK